MSNWTRESASPSPLKDVRTHPLCLRRRKCPLVSLLSACRQIDTQARRWQQTSERENATSLMRRSVRWGHYNLLELGLLSVQTAGLYGCQDLTGSLDTIKGTCTVSHQTHPKCNPQTQTLLLLKEEQQELNLPVCHDGCVRCVNYSLEGTSPKQRRAIAFKVSYVQ